MSIDDRSAIGIIGAGRVGGALAAGLLRAGRPLVAVASRSTERAEELASRLPFATATSIEELVASSGVVFLAVPDDVLADLAGSIGWRADHAAVHLSGGRGLGVLEAAAGVGAMTGCLHPLQTFPGGEAPDEARTRFEGIACGVEAGAPLDRLLNGIAEDLGARTFRLEGVDRATYHAAAVFASNDVVALMAAAAAAWELAGLPRDQARVALSPLLMASARSVAERPLADALTGPVARGDVETVRRHLAALGGRAELSELYRRLGAQLLRLDLGHGSDAEAELRGLLGGSGTPRR